MCIMKNVKIALKRGKGEEKQARGENGESRKARKRIKMETVVGEDQT